MQKTTVAIAKPKINLPSSKSRYPQDMASIIFFIITHRQINGGISQKALMTSITIYSLYILCLGCLLLMISPFYKAENKTRRILIYPL